MRVVRQAALIVQRAAAPPLGPASSKATTVTQCGNQRPWAPASPEPEFGCGPEGKCEDEDSSHSECKCNGERPSPFGLACDIGPALGVKVFEALPADIKPLTVLGAAASGVDRSLFVTTWCQGLRTD